MTTNPIVNSATFTGMTTSASQTVTLPFTPTTGNTLFVWVASDGVVHDVTISQSGNAFTLAADGPVSVGTPGILGRYLSNCGTSTTLTVARSPSAYTHAPCMRVYEIQNFLGTYGGSASQGFSSGAVLDMKLAVNNPSGETGPMLFLSALSSDTDSPATATGSAGWTLDAQQNSSIPYLTTFVTTGIEAKATIDLGNNTTGADWAQYLLVYNLSVPVPITINAVKLVSLGHTEDLAGNLHFSCTYVRGNWASSTFTPAANTTRSADYQLAGGDTFANAWSGLVTAINTLETLTLSMTNTGTEGSGIAHFSSASGLFNSDWRFPSSQTRVCVGTVLHT